MITNVDQINKDLQCIGSNKFVNSDFIKIVLGDTIPGYREVFIQFEQEYPLVSKKNLFKGAELHIIVNFIGQRKENNFPYILKQRDIILSKLRELYNIDKTGYKDSWSIGYKGSIHNITYLSK